jgi:tetratricopeptide (TPR) repeat protein
MLVWAESNRYSVRAQGFAAEELVRLGRPDLAEQRLILAIRDIPDSAALHVHLLVRKVLTSGVTPADFHHVMRAIQQLPYDSQVMHLLGVLTDFFIKGKTKAITHQNLLDLLQTISEHPDYRNRPAVTRLTDQLRGLVHTRQKQADEALRYFASALEQYRNVETGLAQTAVLASQGLYAAALENLQLARDILKNQPNSTLKRSRAEYEQEIARLQQLLEEDLAQSNPQ